jgi:hypothetical protein
VGKVPAVRLKVGGGVLLEVKVWLYEVWKAALAGMRLVMIGASPQQA